MCIILAQNSQCDQMDRLLVQFLANYIYENLPISI